MKTLHYLETPIIELQSPFSQNADIQIAIKREDLNHQFVSGNKWWKLKYNLQEAEAKGFKTLLTFGGAYSNHIYATAAAARELGFSSIGVIRGERPPTLDTTLVFASGCGMQLHFVSRSDYRRKTESSFIEPLREKWGDFFLIPEGGTNALAVKGCEELGAKLQREVDFDYLCLPVGTGGTLAGLARSLPGKKLVGYAVLKDGDFLLGEAERWGAKSTGFRIETGYHFGGYGKVTEDLKKFVLEFEKNHPVKLDPVYTAKAMYGLVEQLNQGFFPPGSKILFLHTGGMQGRLGFNF